MSDRQDDYTGDVLGCGRTIDELDDYLASGRTPAIREIEDCPECQAALDALSRLRSLTPQVLERDVELADEDDSWLNELFNHISIQARPGRSIPVPSEDTDLHLSQTEGAILSLIRAAGDAVDGALIGRVKLQGDITTPGAEVSVDVRVSVFWQGEPLKPLADTIRQEIREALERHTELHVTAIHITIADMEFATGEEA
ncbi:hypothetical protein GCM10027403_15370 [Arthrobacter tecti]